MKYLIALSILSCCLMSCNTTIGLGRDLQKAGEGLSNTAQKAKPSEEAPSDASR